MIYEKGDFVIVPNKKFIKGKPYQSVYLWICDHADEHGVCFPTRKTLAEEACVNIKTLDKYLNMMIDDRILSKVNRMKAGSKEKTSSLYQVMIRQDEVIPKTVQPTPENGATRTPNIGSGTIPSINNPTQQPATPDGARGKQAFILISEMAKSFPACKKYASNRTQVAAALSLITDYGFDRVMSVIPHLKRTNTQPYFPTITTPLQLHEKWETLIAQNTKKKAEASGKVTPMTHSNDAVRRLAKIDAERKEKEHMREVSRNNEDIRKIQEGIKNLANAKSI